MEERSDNVFAYEPQLLLRPMAQAHCPDDPILPLCQRATEPLI